MTMPAWSRRQFASAAFGVTLGPWATASPAADRHAAGVVVADGSRLWLVDPQRLGARRVAAQLGDAPVTVLAALPQRVAVGRADGRVDLLDRCSARVLASARTLERVGALAWSGDAGHLVTADAEAPTIAVHDAGLRLLRRYAVADLARRQSSRVAAVAAHPTRRSFVVALHDLPELWEIPLDPQAEPIHDGLVHDFRMGEAIASAGYLGVRRSPLAAPLADPFVDPSRPHVVARSRGSGGDDEVLTLNLDIRRAIARVALAGTPVPAAGVVVDHRGEAALLLPHRDGARLSLIGIRRGELIAQFAAPAAGGTLFAPARSPWLWLVAPAGADRVQVHRLDAERFEPVASQTLEGTVAGPATFAADTTHAALPLRAATLQVVVWDTISGREHGRVALAEAPEPGHAADCR